MADPYESGAAAGIREGLGNASMLYNLYTAPERMDMERRRLALEQRAADRGDRALTIQERQTGLAEQVSQRESETVEAQWNKSLGMKPTKASVLFTKMIKEVPQTSPLLRPMIEQIDSGDISTRGEMRTALIQAKASGALTPVRASLREEAAKALGKGDRQRASKLMGLYESTSDDKFEDFVDDVMGKPYQLRRKANERPAPATPPPGDLKWDERTQSWLQQSGGGEWKKVVQAPSSTQKRAVYDNNGNLVYSEGDVGDLMTKKTQGDIESKLVEGQDNVVRLEEITSSFDPEFLSLAGKARATLLNKQAQINPSSLSNEDQQYLERYSVFEQNSSIARDLWIKAITGAQMSQQEARRLMKDVPNIGTNWLGGDSAAKYLAKLKNTMEQAKAANTRYRYYLVNGLSPQVIGKLIKDGKAAPLSQFTVKEPPKPDDVIDGYRFRGGDPNDENNYTYVGGK
jgi:hypothetical protein